MPYIERTPLFKGCSAEFIHQIVRIFSLGKIMRFDLSYKFIRFHKNYLVCVCSLQVIRLEEEFYLPEEVILEQGSAVDQLYFVCQGALVSSILGIIS
jgi:hyperpolarization activated cyclic nucleotide-gated potassium channel 4